MPDIHITPADLIYDLGVSQSSLDSATINDIQGGC